MIKYSVAYWVKSRLQDSNRPAWDALLPALERYVRDGAHPEIDFEGTALELANALYVAWKKRVGVEDGVYPTPLEAALEAARRLEVEPGQTVLDPGCAFGNLLWAAQQCKYRAIGIEVREWAVAWAKALGFEVKQGDFNACAVPPFDAVLCNPTYGRQPGSGDRTVSCLQRIADLARPGTQVAAILPAGFMAKTRPAAQVQVCRRYQVLSEEPLDPDLFKPLAVPLTTLQVNGSG